jgi:hypothetical protein
MQPVWDLARSPKVLAPQEKMTVQEAVLMTLQNAEMNINHIIKCVQYWQKCEAHKRNFIEK